MPALDMVKDRLLKRIKKNGTCWDWTGYIWANGYGNFVCLGEQYAHRVSYRLFEGIIPKNLVIDHLCRNRRCVNPKHLELTTQQENAHRGDCTKLTDKEVDLIRRLYKSKQIKQSSLADKFNINQSQVSRIINGLRWGEKCSAANKNI